MRARHVIALLIGSQLGASACGFPTLPRLSGGDGGDGGNDGNRDDSMQGGADANGSVDFSSAEGGEVRFEFINVFGGAQRARVMAFFEADDDVDFHQYPDSPGCTVMTDDTRWPTSQPMNRTYVDIGEVKLTNGTQSLMVMKASMPTDSYGRMHQAGNWYSHFYPGTPGSVDNDGPMHITEKTAYDVIFSSSPSWPAQNFPDAIYFPAAFTAIDPPPTATVALTAGTSLGVTWSVVDSQQPAGVPPPRVLVAFVGTGQGPVVWCLEPTNDGSMTIMGNIVDQIRAMAPTGGTMVRQVYHHQLRELTNGSTVSKRRIDMIGAWSFTQPFTVP